MSANRPVSVGSPRDGETRMSTPMVREAVALFDDAGLLEGAVSDLQGRGFDRADISFLAQAALEDQPNSSEGLADNPATPRETPVTATDIRQERVLATSMVATIAAFAAAGFTVATGGAAALAAAAAIAAGGGVGAVGAWFGSRLGDEEAAYYGARRGAALGAPPPPRRRSARPRGAAPLFAAGGDPRRRRRRGRGLAQRPRLSRPPGSKAPAPGLPLAGAVRRIRPGLAPAGHPPPCSPLLQKTTARSDRGLAPRPAARYL